MIRAYHGTVRVQKETETGLFSSIGTIRVFRTGPLHLLIPSFDTIQGNEQKPHKHGTDHQKFSFPIIITVGRLAAFAWKEQEHHERRVKKLALHFEGVWILCSCFSRFGKLI